jgi:hypothetical protein
MKNSQHFFTLVLLVFLVINIRIFRITRLTFLAAEAEDYAGKSKLKCVAVFGAVLWYNLLFLVIFIVHLYEMNRHGTGFTIVKFLKFVF